MAIGHSCIMFGEKIDIKQRLDMYLNAKKRLKAIENKYGNEVVKELWSQAEEELAKEDKYAIKSCIKDYMKQKNMINEVFTNLQKEDVDVQ